MTKSCIDIANRFLAEQPCSRQEIRELKKWLSESAVQPEVEQWLLAHWEASLEVSSEALIESVFSQIKDYEDKYSSGPLFSWAGFVKAYQRIAAVLLIPLIGLGVLYWINQSKPTPVQFTETIAMRGQKSQIVLSDGTKVWLNSDTKIKYPGQFAKNQRDVYLEGEAFFEVARNDHQPFIVHTAGPQVKVTGTKFNVKAYKEDNQVETSLFEGSVEVCINKIGSDHPTQRRLTPGQSVVCNQNTDELVFVRFPEDEISGWKKNQLIFRDDTFVNLVKKIERWYNIEVVYDEKKFNNRRLTVELYEGERLEKLMEILGLALSVDFQYSKGKIILTPKNS